MANFGNPEGSGIGEGDGERFLGRGRGRGSKPAQNQPLRRPHQPGGMFFLHFQQIFSKNTLYFTFFTLKSNRESIIIWL